MKFFKKFECEKCDRKFSHQEELMQHLQVFHYKDLPYDCKECNEFFLVWKKCVRIYKENIVTKKTGNIKRLLLI